jgi:hypothetical protein
MVDINEGKSFIEDRVYPTTFVSVKLTFVAFKHHLQP